MKLTKQTLKQLINEVLNEVLHPYSGADPQGLFREIIRDYDFDVISDDGESGYAETPQREYVIKYFNYPVFKEFELFHNGDEVVIMTANDSGKQQGQKLKRILKHIQPYKKQMNEQRRAVPLEDKNWMEKIIADYNLVPETQLPNGKIISASTLDGKYFLAHSSKGTMLSRGNLPPRERRKSENRLVLILPSESPKKINQKMAKISKYLKDYSR